MIPTAYVYPAGMRSTRDLLRRRMHLMHHRSELLAHIQNTNSQYNLPGIGKKIAYKTNREGVSERFPDASVRSSAALDLKLIDAYDEVLRKVELEIPGNAKQRGAQAFHLLDTVPGIGKILGLVILYAINAAFLVFLRRFSLRTLPSLRIHVKAQPRTHRRGAENAKITPTP